MTINHLISPAAVKLAIAGCDLLGRERSYQRMASTIPGNTQCSAKPTRICPIDPDEKKGESISWTIPLTHCQADVTLKCL
jgi:hypothetical protein